MSDFEKGLKIINIDEAKNIYSTLIDEESKMIFGKRLLYSITGDYKYILDIVDFDDEYLKLKQHNDSGEKIILFGAGIYGRAISKYFSDIKWECFVDNNPKEDMIEGLPVITFNELTEKHSDAIVVLCSCLYNEDIYLQCTNAGIPKENIIVLVKPCNNGMLDKQYFEFLPENKETESFVDAGALDGDSSKRFVKWCDGDYSNIWVFEPDPESYKLCKKRLDIPNCTIYNMGLFDKEDTISFSAGLGGASNINNDGEISIKVDKLDNVLKDQKVTFIKMDIEGSELEALQGAENIIRKQKPRLAICVYHKAEDIISIPTLLLKYNPNYKFCLRHYSNFNIETVLYAF